MAHVSVSIDDHHLTELDDVVQALRASGLRVEQVLDGLGVITGSVDDGQRRSLERVPGVLSVDGALSYQLPSPDSPVQ